jgi:hypothetical protein
MLIGQSETPCTYWAAMMDGWLVVMKQFSVGFNFPSQPRWVSSVAYLLLT